MKKSLGNFKGNSRGNDASEGKTTSPFYDRYSKNVLLICHIHRGQQKFCSHVSLLQLLTSALCCVCSSLSSMSRLITVS